MDEATLKSAIYEWIVGEVGGAPFDAAVIFSDQATPRPTRPYVTIRLNPQVTEGMFDEDLGVDNDGIATIRGYRTVTVALQSFGPRARDIMNVLQGSLSKESVRSTFFNGNDLSLINTGEILNLTNLLDTEFEERAAMDLMVGFAQEITDDVGRIETVEVTGNEGEPQIIELP